MPLALETHMIEGLFQPLHLLVILLVTVMSFGMPFLAGYFLGRYVEMKKLKRP
jgi:hypothetical protein